MKIAENRRGRSRKDEQWGDTQSREGQKGTEALVLAAKLRMPPHHLLKFSAFQVGKYRGNVHALQRQHLEYKVSDVCPHDYFKRRDRVAGLNLSDTN